MNVASMCVSQVIDIIPNTLSAATVSTAMKKNSATTKYFHDLKYGFLCDALTKHMAIIPAIMLKNTADSSAMPNTQSYIVNIICLFYFHFVNYVFKSFGDSFFNE